MNWGNKYQMRVLQVLDVAGIAAYLAACSYVDSDWPVIKAANERKPGPDFALTDSNGKLAKISEYRGKVVLLNFWATWCGPRAVEIPWFFQFHREYKDGDLVVLGASEGLRRPGEDQLPIDDRHRTSDPTIWPQSLAHHIHDRPRRARRPLAPGPSEHERLPGGNSDAFRGREK